MRIFLIIGLCLSFMSCAYGPIETQKNFVEPRYGMNKLAMIDLLGKPEKIEIYKKSDLSRVEVYFYVRKYQSTQEEVPICLINGKIAGWGETFYEDHVNQDEDTRIK